MSKSPRAAQRGFSLVEVLIALALMAVVILAVLALVTAGMQRAYGGKKMTEASFLAQSIVERANQKAAQNLFNSTHASTRSITWSKTSAAGAVSPSAETAGTPGPDERNRWRALFANAGLPASAANPARLTIRAEAMPPGATFATAAMVRITVDVDWAERGVRTRRVRLQALNFRT